MSTIIESIEQRQLRRVPRFAPGDRVRVHFQVVEGTRRRTQVFEGVVIARRGAGARETFTVRKQSFGVGVERTFPVHSPKVERLEVVAQGRRAASQALLPAGAGRQARSGRRAALGDRGRPRDHGGGGRGGRLGRRRPGRGRVDPRGRGRRGGRTRPRRARSPRTPPSRRRGGGGGSSEESEAERRIPRVQGLRRRPKTPRNKKTDPAAHNGVGRARRAGGDRRPGDRLGAR